MTKTRFSCAVAAGALFAWTLASAQPYDLSWHTVDGGGYTFSTGGSYSLGGTIGQHDAGPINSPMIGGAFSLVGGFWPGAAVVCTCPGDLNGDTQKNGLDIQQFTQCIVAGGACSCAEIDGIPGLNNGDVAAFVTDLLNGAACP